MGEMFHATPEPFNDRGKKVVAVVKNECHSQLRISFTLI